jgi:hypothetical protein
MSLMPLFPTDDDHPSLWLSDPAGFALDSDEDDALDLLLPADASLDDQLALEDLLDQGFTWEEGLGLLCLRLQVLENPEMHEHPRMQFARWLVTHGHLSETLC